MKRHLVIIYWLLLLVSTLAIGGVTFFLLQRESARLRTAAVNSAVDSGTKIAASLELLVEEDKTSSLDALTKMPEEGLARSLLDWKNANPYASSVILYQPGRGLDLPIAYSSERDSIEPYLRTPNGRWIWSDSDTPTARFTITSFTGHSGPIAFNNSHRPPPNPAAPAPPDNSSRLKEDRLHIRQATQNSADPASTTASVGLRSNLPFNGSVSVNGGNLGISSVEISLPDAVPNPDSSDGQTYADDLAKLKALTPEVIVAQFEGNLVLNGGMQSGQWVVNQQTLELTTGNLTPLPAKPDHGWLVIGPQDNMRLLGWVRPAPGARVRGVVLNWDALARPFANALGGRIDPSSGYILRNPAGQVVAAHFANGRMVAGGAANVPFEGPNAKPLLQPINTIPLDSTALPGWALEVYYDANSAFASGFMAISTILVTLLVISGLVGGTLLMREARREAVEAARKTGFVSNVSHELKTPLTTIRMYAELLGEGRVRDPGKQRTYLTTIISESQRLTRLVNNVLDFSRLEQGRKQYHPDDVALAPVIENVLEAQRPRLEEAGFEIETEFPYGRDVRVHADKDALEQVLINLIDNAMKYAAAGRWLGIRVSVDGEHALIAVSDRGPGVPPAHQQRIFEMFHRVDDSITAKLPGAGLGLSIARRLLRDQEGDLCYVPNSPCGSSFVASLPLASTISAAKIS
ncbi:MAG TPA: HAMP domain-containing sensor histidine kinase [Opitutales bacterium]|nr:HAMP domain-containing sensor histidine kinase [Opitutales bacterium]